MLVMMLKLCVMMSSVMLYLVCSFCSSLRILVCMVMLRVVVGLFVMRSEGCFVIVLVMSMCWVMLLDIWCG